MRPRVRVSRTTPCEVPPPKPKQGNHCTLEIQGPRALHQPGGRRERGDTLWSTPGGRVNEKHGTNPSAR